MCCEGREEALALYAGGELPEAERTALEAHVQTCEACRAYVDELMAVRATLGDFNEAAEDGIALGALSARVRAVPGRKTRSRVTMPRVLVVASMAACALLAAAITQMRSPRATDAPIEEKQEAPVVPVADAPVVVAVAATTHPKQKDRVLAKILTDDPGVVIILLASDNDRGDSHGKAKPTL